MLRAGEKSVAFALTEPDRVTGVNLGTTATPDAEGYPISGNKWLISNSDVTSHFLVLGPAEGGLRLPHPRSAPRLSIQPLPETMGCKGDENGRLTFDNVRVDQASSVGKPGERQDILERALEINRVSIAASSPGTAQHALDLSLEHVKKRITFDKLIAQRQAI
jgi:alkylation response protein AidB-like acyl-CoA dehydrogenase